MDSRTRASLTLVAFVTVLIGTFVAFAVWAAHQDSSAPIDHSNPITNWHLPADDPAYPAS